MGGQKQGRWRDGFHKDEVIRRIRPKELKAHLLNPHKGTTTFQRFNGDELYPGLEWNDAVGPVEFPPFNGNLQNRNYPQCSISYCRWVWNVIEPEKGKYAWHIIDGSLEAARVRGQTLQMRIQPFITAAHVPDWYLADGGTLVDEREIDHNNPKYLEHWGDLVRAFGERYDGHPDLESFDIAYGGACGECGGNTSPEVAEKLVDVHLDSFKKTQLLSMLGTHGCRYASDKRDGRIGWRADCIGDLRNKGRGYVPDNLAWNHMYDAYPKEVVEDGVKETWRRAPVTLETCGTVGSWFKGGHDLDWIIEQTLKYHPTVFMPKSVAIPEEFWDRIIDFDDKIGYKFVIRQLTIPLEAQAGQPMQFVTFIDNVGVAPIYAPYKLAYRFRQEDRSEVVISDADIRTWMPDHTWFIDSIAMPKNLNKGEVWLDVAITDAAGSPKVKLAIEGEMGDGWYALASMGVV